LNPDGSAKVSFTAYLKQKDQLKPGEPWLLTTDVPVVVPVNKVVKLIVTADPEGIIHSWTIPSFGMKIDAIPGRLNEDWFQATIEGTYYGQCSELCGKDHANMPITRPDGAATSIRRTTRTSARCTLYLPSSAALSAASCRS